MVTETKETQTENKVLIEEMVREAKTFDAPTEATTNPIVHEGDAEQPAPMTITELSKRQWAYIYDTQTGESSLCNVNMLRQKLGQKRTDGSFVFTTVKPKIKPQRGSLKCMLHADDPKREYYDKLGLPTCKKSNLTAPYMVEQHTKKRHPQEWAIIERERLQKEKDEDRAFQKAFMAQALAPKEKELPFDCDQCDKSFSTRIALEGHKRSHK